MSRQLSIVRATGTAAAGFDKLTCAYSAEAA